MLATETGVAWELPTNQNRPATETSQAGAAT
jgi:hypothetical protein